MEREISSQTERNVEGGEYRKAEKEQRPDEDEKRKGVVTEGQERQRE